MIELRFYQKECSEKLGVPELVSRLIGDEMGTGKTVECLDIDRRLRAAANRPFTVKTLIVAPLSVHGHWHKHIRMVIGSRPKIYIIDRKNRPGFIAALKKDYDYYIVHWEGLRLKDTEAPIRRVGWFHVIADEIHRAKNRKAQQTRALKQLAPVYKTGASGTPADNKPQDLWSILNWLYPKQFSSFWRFVNTYCEQETTTNERTGQTFRKIVGVKEDALPALRAQMEPFYIRRLKKQVLRDLPPKQYTSIEVDLLPRQRRAYDQMRKHMLAWVGEQEDQELSAAAVIAQLVRLQQFALASPDISYKYVITKQEREKALREEREPEPERRMVVVLEEPSSKADMLMEIIEDHEDEKHVVFSQSRSMIDVVEARLIKSGLTVAKYTGKVPQGLRDAELLAFQAGKRHVFAATIAAGGESIDLTRSPVCHFLDRHWSPFRNVQAEDRLHRSGQENSVQIFDYVARNTIDLGRLQQIAGKLSTLRLLLGDSTEPEEYLEAVQEGK